MHASQGCFQLFTSQLQQIHRRLSQAQPLWDSSPYTLVFLPLLFKVKNVRKSNFLAHLSCKSLFEIDSGEDLFSKVEGPKIPIPIVAIYHYKHEKPIMSENEGCSEDYQYIQI